jgi:alanine racemase
MTIGILPLGYYDGLDRRLSNKAYVLVGGQACRILGRICMNLTIVDLTHIQNPKVGDEVIVISHHLNDPNNLYELSKQCATIPYDLLVHLSETTRRRITD